ncbi:putative ferroxidase [Xylariaceae sp. FL0662B]|nr:putative ferroxidase [Xylariaceae sp. FL0662B]
MHRDFLLSLVTLAQATGSFSKRITYNWEATWVFGAPDGFGRPVVGINNSWPCPAIEVTVGDIVVINLLNKLGNETTGLHFHGISQINTGTMDGATGSTQCPVAPDHSISYKFYADSPGTYWWHSHDMGQYADGLRGPLIIHDPEDPYAHDYDEELVMTISDWYYDQTITLMSQMIEPNNTKILPPRPNNTIVNEGRGGDISFEPGKTYRFRIINWSALTAAFVHFDSHDMDIIGIDGSYVVKQTVQQLRLGVGQRSDVLITAAEDSNENYPYLVSLDTNANYKTKNPNITISYPHNFTGMLVTDPSKDMDKKDVVYVFDPFDDTALKPYDNRSALGPVNKYWVLGFDYCHDVNGYPRACFNDTVYIMQTVPTMYSVASLGENNTQLSAYGQVNPFTIGYGDVLEIVINNHNDANHPFHLHGHQFQVLERPATDAGNWTGDGNINQTPPTRDTVEIYANSYAVLRLVANNPGVFLLHCHIEWHVDMGLSATLIEAPEKLINYKIPQDHIDACKYMGIPTTGNAAGNSDWANTDGFITVPPTTYTGALYVQSS